MIITMIFILRNLIGIRKKLIKNEEKEYEALRKL